MIVLMWVSGSVFCGGGTEVVCEGGSADGCGYRAGIIRKGTG